MVTYLLSADDALHLAAALVPSNYEARSAQFLRKTLGSSKAGKRKTLSSISYEYERLVATCRPDQ
jgi:hypothetical protein